MWEISKKHLQDNETIVFSDKPSLLSCFFSILWLIIASFYLLSKVFFIGGSKFNLMPLFLISFPAIILTLRRYSTRYILTNFSIKTKSGILNNTISTIPYKYINAIELEEPLLGKIFRYAHLRIKTSGGGGFSDLTWKCVKKPYEVKKHIETKMN